MSLPELLYELSTDRLREIVRRRAQTFRGIPRITDKRELVRFLASALNNYDSALRAIHQTSLPQIQTLIAIVARGGDVAFEELAAAAGQAHLEQLEEAIESLETLGLAIRNRSALTWRVYVPNGAREAAPVPAPLRHRLAEWLPRQLKEAVERIHQNLNLPEAPGADRAALARQIVHYITSPGRARHALDSLSADARDTLEGILRHGGVVSQHSLVAQLDSRKRSQLMTGEWTSHWHVSKPRNGVEELLGHGLIIVETGSGWGAWDVIVPGDVVEPLLGRSLIGSIVPAAPVPTTLSADGLRPTGHSALIRDVVYLLAFIAKNEAPATAAGNIHKSSIKTLAKSLTIPEQQYAEFVYCLARDAGLLAPHGRKGLYALTARGESWMRGNRDSQMKSLFEAWHLRTSWDERAVDPMWDGKTFRSTAEITEVRDPVIDILRDREITSPGSFVSLGSIVELAKYRWWARYCFDMPGRQLDVPEMDSAEGPYGFVGSNLRLVRAIACRSLYWLGLTETYLDPAQQEYVRLSDLGRRMVAGGASDGTDEEGARFVLQPNLEVYAPPGLWARDLYRLFRMAEPAGIGLLAISRDSLRKAFDSGEQADELIAFLSERSVSGLPQNVEYLIREVGGKHGHIRIGQAGLYIQVNDPLLMRELQAQKGLKIHFRDQLSDTIALVSGDSMDAVMKQLRQAGYMPVTSPGASETELSHKVPPSPFGVPVSRVTSSEKDARIDWDAIAATEDRPWDSGEEPAAKSMQSNGDSGIKALVRQAIQEGRCMEIAYRRQGENFDIVRVVEPEFMDDQKLHAYCRLRQDDRVFNLSNITAARLTNEIFALDE